MLDESMDGENKLSPKERLRYAIKGNERELARRKEDGELKEDYPLEEAFYLQQNDQSLSKKDLGDRALVIAQDQFEKFGYLDITLPNGETTTIFPEDTRYNPDDNFIIFPEDLGELLDKE